MVEPSANEDEPSAGGRARLEIRVIFFVVLGLMVAGGLYIFVFGSPTNGRAANDSSDGPAAPIYQKTPAANPKTPVVTSH